MRLIDADALKEKIIKERDAIPLKKTERYGFCVEFQDPHGMSMRGGIRNALRCMEETPTIDAVPVEKYHELLENFIDYACSGVPNLSPYCMNRCVECVDKRGWCKRNECRGFNPDVRKEK